MPEPTHAARRTPHVARTCAVCAAPVRPALLAGAAFLVCRRCGYAALAAGSARPEYWHAGDEDAGGDLHWTTARRRLFLATLDLLGRETAGRRLLDIGGGIGYFAELAIGRGWDAVSLDTSERATAAARERLGAARALTALPDRLVGAFDVVTLWCVVAHTERPRAVVRAAARALRSGGVLWLTTPNLSFEIPFARLRALLGRPDRFAADDHVGHFAAPSLDRLLTREGFSRPRLRFQGITEQCIAAGAEGGALVAAKRLWNQLAFVAARAGLPPLVSELQVTARRVR